MLGASGSGIIIGGTTTLLALGDASGATGASGSGTNAIGGDALMTVSAGQAYDSDTGVFDTVPGTIGLEGVAKLDASALAYQGIDDPTGNATGGTATIETTDPLGIGGATVTAFAGALLDSSANANSLGAGSGLIARGGRSTISSEDGTVSLGSAGGPTEIASDAQGGYAGGGTATLEATANGVVTAFDAVSIHASGFGGVSNLAGDTPYAGTGGVAALNADGGGGITLTTAAIAADGGYDATPRTVGGGSGRGGTATVSVVDEGSASEIQPTAITVDKLTMTASGVAENGGTGDGAGFGGTAQINVEGGSFTATGAAGPVTDARGVDMHADGRGGDALMPGRDPEGGGSGTGGTVKVDAGLGGTITLSGLRARAGGTGGGAVGSDIGGTGLGGTITLDTVDDGTASRLSLGVVDALAIATGGDAASAGGAAIGGAVSLAANPFGTISGTSLSLATASTGGTSATVDGSPTIGAQAHGGLVGVTVGDSATVDFTGAAILGSAARGGAGAASGSGGSATGGMVTLSVADGGTLAGGAYSLVSTDIGGAGGAGTPPGAFETERIGPRPSAGLADDGGTGGAASGGTVGADVAGGTVAIASLSLENDATGGRGGRGAGYPVVDDGTADPTLSFDGGRGGAGGQVMSGGTTALTIRSGASFTADTIALGGIVSGGIGGDGGNGHTATGGAVAAGGTGGTGGDAIGGDVSLSVTDAAMAVRGIASDGSGPVPPATRMVSYGTTGTGGAGGAGGYDPSTGGTGRAASGDPGDGIGGALAITTNGTGTASLMSTDLEAGPVSGGVGRAGRITISALDDSGDAPPTPLAFDDLTVIDTGASTSDTVVTVNSVAPIRATGTSTITTTGGITFAASGNGNFTGGTLDVRESYAFTSTRTDPAAGLFAIDLSLGSIRAEDGGAIALTSLRTTAGGLQVVGGALSADTLDIHADLDGAVASFALGTVTGGSIDLTGAGASSIASATVTGDIMLATTGSGGTLSATSLASGQGSITLDATGEVTVPTLSAGDVVRVTSDGAGHFGAIDAGTGPGAPPAGQDPDPGSILLHTAQDLTLDDALAAPGSIVLISDGGTIGAQGLSSGAGNPIAILAGGDVTTTGALTAGTADAPGAIDIGGIPSIAGLGRRPDASDVIALLGRNGIAPSGGAVTLHDVTAAGIVVSAGGALSFDTISASGAAALLGGGVLTGTSVSGGDVTVLGDTSVAIDGITTTGDLLADGGDAVELATTGTGTTLTGLRLSGTTGDFAIGSATVNAGTLSIVSGASDLTVTPVRDGAASVTDAVLTTGDLRIAAASGTDIAADATGTIDATALAASGDTTLIAGRALTLTGATVSGALALRATTGIVDATGLAVGSVDATAGAGLTLGSSGDLVVTNAAASGGSVAIVAADALTIQGSGVTASGDATLHAGGTLAATAGVGAGGTVDATSDTSSVTLADVAAARIDASGTAVTLTAPGDLALGTVTATGGDLAATSGGALTATSLSASNDVTLHAAEGLTLGTIHAGDLLDVTSDNDAVTLADADAARLAASGTAVTLSGAGDLVVTAATATAGDLTVTAGGSLRADSLTAIAGDLSATADGTLAAAGLAATHDATLHAGGSLTVASATVGNMLTLTSDAGAIDATGLAAALVDASGAAVTLAAPGDLRVGSAVARDGDVAVTAGGSLTTDSLIARQGSIAVRTGGDAAVSALEAGGGILLVAGRSGQVGSATAGEATGDAAARTAASGPTASADDGSIIMRAAGDLTLTADANATGSIILVSDNGRLGTQGLNAGTDGNVVALAGGDIAVSSVAAPALFDAGGPGAVAGLGDDPTTTEVLGLLAQNGMVASGGAISIGTATVGTASIDAGGGIAIASLTTGLASDRSDGGVTLAAADAIAIDALASAGPVTATGDSVTLTAPGDLRIATITATGSDATIVAAGDLIGGAVATTRGTIAATAGGAIDLASLSAGDSVVASAGTTIHAGSVIAGTDAGAAEGSGLFGSAVLRAGGAITVDDATQAIGSIVLSSRTAGISLADLTVGADGNAAILAGGPIVLGAVAVPGALYVEGAGALSALGGDAGPAAIFAALATGVPTASGGAIAIGRTDAGSATVAADGDLALTDAFATNGDTRLIAAGAITAHQVTPGGALDAQSGGALTLDTVDAGGAVDLVAGGAIADTAITGARIAIAGGPLTLGALTATDGGLTAGTTSGSLTAGDVTATGDADLSAGGDIAIASLAAGDIALTSRAGGIAIADGLAATGAITGSAAGDASLGPVVSAGRSITFVASTLRAGTVAGSQVAFRGEAIDTGAVATSDGAIDLVATTGDLATGALTARGADGLGAITLSAGGALTTGDIAADGDIAAAAGGPLTTGGLAAGGTTDLASSAATIATGTIASRGAITASGQTGLALGSISSSSGTITLAADAGGITTGALTAAGAIDVTGGGGGGVALGAVGAETVTARSTGGDLSIGATDATGTVTLDAARTLTLASIAGTDIALGSADIAIAADATIGSARTARVAFVDTGTGRTTIGDTGDAATGDYALSGAELASAHANAISIGNRPGTADTLIGDLTLRGPAMSGANLLGSAARFVVTSSGAIRVVGAAHFTGLADDDTVTLRSTGGDITGVLPGGSIALDDGNGVLAGTLALEAGTSGGSGGTILFATPAATNAIASATGTADVDAALGNPGTLDNPAGYLRADTVSVAFATAFYTQNSGASPAIMDRAGVTAGSGGLLLMPTTAQAESPARLVLNARLDRDGATLTGDQVFAALALQPTGFATGATLNSCLLDASNCGVTTTVPAGPVSPADMAATALVQALQPVQDVVAQVEATSGLGNNAAFSFTTPALISEVNLGQLIVTPQIDEPVTGTGNDDLWVGIGIGRETAPVDAAKGANVGIGLGRETGGGGPVKGANVGRGRELAPMGGAKPDDTSHK